MFKKGHPKPKNAYKFPKGHQMNKGKIPWNKGLKGVQIAWNKGIKMWSKRKHPLLGKKAFWAKDNPQIFKKGHKPWNVGKKRPEISGENHPRWKSEKPKCILCGKRVANYGIKRCWDCYVKILKRTRPLLWLKEKNPAWKDGKGREPYSFNFTDELKESIRKRDNYICRNCDMTEEEHLIVYGKVLLIHHTDYNKHNSDEINLISLCQQCHTRTNFNRKYWTEYFQNGVKNGKPYTSSLSGL